jgi:hypothetical protein
MSWRFRKSFQVFPGVRINLSKSGLSTTIGDGPLHLNFGPQGVTGTVSVPGTGVSFRHRIRVGPTRTPPASDSSVFPSPHFLPESREISHERNEIRSASTREMTSGGLLEFRRIISSAQAERNLIDADLHTAKRDSAMADAQYASWYYGWFLKRIRPNRFAELEIQAADSRARVEELVEQRRLTTVATEIAIEDEHRAFFGRLCDAFAALTGAANIWDTVATQKTDQFRQRTRATQSLERNPVRFCFDQLDILTCEWEVPRLRNANGGDMFLYPGFLVYHISRDAFSTIDFSDIEIHCEPSRFIE